MALFALARPHATSIQLPEARRGNLSMISQRRRQATIDLIHSSAHLRRDIGFDNDYRGERGQ